MPELPEVEGARRHLLALMAGRRIEGLDVLDTKLWHAAVGLDASMVAGQRAVSVERHAKVIQIILGDGLALVLHLKIAGQIALQRVDGARVICGHPYPLPAAALPDTSTRFVLRLEDGDSIFVNDQRRFCWLRLMSGDDAGAFIAAHKFGPDPLDPTFTPAVLQSRLAARKGRPIKAALLDQTCIAGLGNIYVDESLHAARLHPMLRAGDVSRSQVARLHGAIRDVLALAVPVGGAYVVNGRAATPADQKERDFLRAHGRAGLICPDCGPPEVQIVRELLAGRGTYFCPACQRPPRAQRATRAKREEKATSS